MDRFLTIQCAKEVEVEVEEVHVQEHFETPTTKHNNVLVFKFNEKWKDGSGCCEIIKHSNNIVQDGCW